MIRHSVLFYKIFNVFSIGTGTRRMWQRKARDRDIKHIIYRIFRVPDMKVLYIREENFTDQDSKYFGIDDLWIFLGGHCLRLIIDRNMIVQARILVKKVNDINYIVGSQSDNSQYKIQVAELGSVRWTDELYLKVKGNMKYPLCYN
jgi:hypothetical protein